MQTILQLFPQHIKEKLEKHLMSHWEQLEEIRLRIGQPIECISSHRNCWFEDIVFTMNDCIYIMNQLSEHSLYRFEEELKEGYITIRGGHRIGLAGKVQLEDGKVKRIQFITFLNIRIAKEKQGIANSLVPFLYDEKSFYHTLIVGAPQSGKTTLLRDLARIISNGELLTPAKKITIIDERSEIAACYNGIPQHNIGKRTDVIDACPKSEGMMMAIRSLSPEIIIVDEIGKEKDVSALMDALHAGVTIICTVHASSIADAKRRLLLRKLFELNIFKRYVFLYRTTNRFDFLVEDDQTVNLHSNVVR